MTSFTEKFGDNDEYTATLEIEPGETQGWVNGPDGYSASLAALDATGVLTNGRFEEWLVPASIVEEITNWAEANGY